MQYFCGKMMHNFQNLEHLVLSLVHVRRTRLLAD